MVQCKDGDLLHNLFLFLFLFFFNYNEHSEVVNQYKNLYPMVYTKWGKRLYII